MSASVLIQREIVGFQVLLNRPGFHPGSATVCKYVLVASSGSPKGTLLRSSVISWHLFNLTLAQWTEQGETPCLGNSSVAQLSVSPHHFALGGAT